MWIRKQCSYIIHLIKAVLLGEQIKTVRHQQAICWSWLSVAEKESEGLYLILQCLLLQREQLVLRNFTS